jgi:hypothetical protein
MNHTKIKYRKNIKINIDIYQIFQIVYCYLTYHSIKIFLYNILFSDY